MFTNFLFSVVSLPENFMIDLIDTPFDLVYKP